MTYAHAERNLAATRLVVADTMRLLVGRDDIPTATARSYSANHTAPPSSSTCTQAVQDGQRITSPYLAAR
jgi:hypothetical protein